MATKSRLGKGLGALFPDLPGDAQHELDELSAMTPAQREKTVAEALAKPAAAPSAAPAAKDGSVAHAVSADDEPAASATPISRTSIPQVISTASTQAQPVTAPAVDRSKPSQSANGSAHAGKGGKSKSKRAAMPGIGDAGAHPSDLFFGDTTTAVPVTGKSASDESSSAAHNRKQAATKASSRAAKPADVSRETKDNADEPELKPVFGGYLAELNTTDIGPNLHQPRTVFDEEELNELAASIKEVGVLQPIVVRKRPAAQIEQARRDVAERVANGDTEAADERLDSPYELIMGERRWRATQLAGLTTIPAIVKTTADDDMLRDALLENLHRVALNPLEEAAAYQQMIEEFGLTQAQLSKSVSKSRPQIANTLRLLNLPASVQKRVAAGVLSAGHARALLGLTDESEMDKLADRIIAEGLSVRSTEEIVAMKIASGEQPRKARANKNNPWANSPIQQHLENRFDTKVSIKGSKQHGRIEIVFSSPEDMDRILGLLAPQGDAAADPNAGWR
ncbi:ParB/RepB/Spo0J family partition protein [Bifidobacterium biavatii]|uniref:Chromosome partitioning protein ParB n=1 Tax=Bifidobacterium biavatii DSM 23969 TaxID=1437608 RepID=A0A086ZSP4_9BIFI|nr:ParB/RepB/Spo0J family partition protein [Bifidobacterium biavatii]KFI49544.1 chromosome partitioning protein ParB [Bifidobacterium biavatii DSM 23969]